MHKRMTLIICLLSGVVGCGQDVLQPDPKAGKTFRLASVAQSVSTTDPYLPNPPLTAAQYSDIAKRALALRSKSGSVDANKFARDMSALPANARLRYVSATGYLSYLYFHPTLSAPTSSSALAATLARQDFTAVALENSIQNGSDPATEGQTLVQSGWPYSVPSWAQDLQNLNQDLGDLDLFSDLNLLDAIAQSMAQEFAQTTGMVQWQMDYFEAMVGAEMNSFWQAAAAAVGEFVLGMVAEYYAQQYYDDYKDRHADTDHDGVNNENDPDDDGDGKADVNDTDDDGDGDPDATDGDPDDPKDDLGPFCPWCWTDYFTAQGLLDEFQQWSTITAIPEVSNEFFRVYAAKAGW